MDNKRIFNNYGRFKHSFFIFIFSIASLKLNDTFKPERKNTHGFTQTLDSYFQQIRAWRVSSLNPVFYFSGCAFFGRNICAPASFRGIALRHLFNGSGFGYVYFLDGLLFGRLDNHIRAHNRHRTEGPF